MSDFPEVPSIGPEAVLDDLARQYIDGAWRTGSGDWDVIDFNPWTGDKLAAITVATADEVDAAYRAAERAQREWAAVTPGARRRVIQRLLDLIDEREPLITSLITAELGGTRARVTYELGLVREALREALHLPLRAEGRILPSPVEGKENYLTRMPVGTVCVISPYTFPLFLGLKTVVPALALGNAVVLKPHQSSPICGGTLLARLLADAGLPTGLFNVVVTDIAEVGDVLIEHPVPRVICFTGSEVTGRHVASVAGGHFKRVVLELGGNSALIVLDDADTAYAADAAVFSRFMDQGQMCMAANRLLVDRSVLSEFTEHFLARVSALRVGDPGDPTTDIGPLMDARYADHLWAQVERAVSGGARVLHGGERRGNLVPPTVLTDVPADSPLHREEIFGPVVLLTPVEGEDEAVALANDSAYGLSGAVHTRDIQRGLRVAHRIETGIVHVNDATVADEPIVPYGGMKCSGLGRLNGDALLDAFTDTKWISVQHGRTVFPL
ncbi:aldehyde dehydrogenase family protein [Streptomyces sp. ST2-7A]|uniref:aldehyde dehydrogenase family protein n=1 Tax=Streptomyces sp. ST2-7A TaxID=2907214 RepID=UPI001F169D46|nr:aldehyde dehydrogenase family protein [Streptomyces sp. ST2-7A]MCE7083314.1 aldehyde dehydrogenase family protein [Streptomyces sp. ST2-7A]